MYKTLSDYKNVNDMKHLTINEKEHLANDIRKFLIEKVSKTGGHLASNLGVVELTIALFSVLDLDRDKLIWDVGHQSYVHKILTGRSDKFDTLRQFDGLSGFPKKSESNYDFFETGHSSTSISAALGMATARDLKGAKYEVAAVIGDGALTGGMAFEALNDLGYRKTKVIIILNDNQMSIAKNVGGMSRYLRRLRSNPKYTKLKQGVRSSLKKIPNIGSGMANTLEKLKNGIKQMVVPGMLFEDMGIKYIGPVDGHNFKELNQALYNAKNMKGPVIVHVLTKKGKGYEHAEKSPDKFHGIGPFDCESGEIECSSCTTYSKAFGDALIKCASKNQNVVALTAAMRDGTGLKEYSERFPNRFFDVGIAEQHGVTLAAGMANSGLKPVFAVYSTFLQRAYDQILHDVCMQKLPVILAIDRAGLVGEDGETHQGIFDISYLSNIPNMVITAPKCTSEMESMLEWAVNSNFPVAIRYPRGGDKNDTSLNPKINFELGKWEVIKDTGSIAIIAVGRMVQTALDASNMLEAAGIKSKVINGCFIKPIDKEMIKTLALENEAIITLEDNLIIGGFGAMVSEEARSINSSIKIMTLGFKDEFIPHGSVNLLFKQYGLDAEGIFNSIMELTGKKE
ncbi:MAG: 1-deoxy-D-xylulose-5-phosphate synthase [Solirubrobacterales bacterium]